MIYVYDEASLDSMMREVWSRMNAALVAGDKPRALVALNTGAQEKYGARVRRFVAVHANDCRELLSPGIGMGKPRIR